MYWRAVALGLSVLLPSQACAWGTYGHSIVAELAERRLRPAVTANLEKLIGTASLASISSWADDYKFTPTGRGTKRWHYVNKEITGKELGFSDFCSETDEGDCLPEALKREITVLSDPNVALTARQTALRMVVHLVGDLSQPHHCASRAGDAGANGIKVEFSGVGPDGKDLTYTGTLHLLWDDVLLNAHNFSWGGYVDEVETNVLPKVNTPRLDSSSGTPNYIDNWTGDCHAAAKEAYSFLPSGWEAVVAATSVVKLDKKYQQAVQPLIVEQLALGGLRLAAVLNRALAN